LARRNGRHRWHWPGVIPPPQRRDGAACFTEARSDDRKPAGDFSLPNRATFLFVSQQALGRMTDRSPSASAVDARPPWGSPRQLGPVLLLAAIGHPHPPCGVGICWHSQPLEPRGWGGLPSPQASGLFVRRSRPTASIKGRPIAGRPRR
jgi:hypothetical protein